MLALVVGTLCGTALSQYSAEFSSYYSGNRYDFRLTREQLLNTPAWLEDEPNPPLSPRTAKIIEVWHIYQEDVYQEDESSDAPSDFQAAQRRRDRQTPRGAHHFR